MPWAPSPLGEEGWAGRRRACERHGCFAHAGLVPHGVEISQSNLRRETCVLPGMAQDHCGFEMLAAV
ncbi:MAG: hypothetical protein FWD12_14255, partial [Alphaproteobacteria bacterium]|nr:hypothetical protein [Alphaproteobacteria bacterium]